MSKVIIWLDWIRMERWKRLRSITSQATVPMETFIPSSSHLIYRSCMSGGSSIIEGITDLLIWFQSAQPQDRRVGDPKKTNPKKDYKYSSRLNWLEWIVLTGINPIPPTSGFQVWTETNSGHQPRPRGFQKKWWKSLPKAQAKTCSRYGYYGRYPIGSWLPDKFEGPSCFQNRFH